MFHGQIESPAKGLWSFLDHPDNFVLVAINNHSLHVIDYYRNVSSTKVLNMVCMFSLALNEQKSHRNINQMQTNIVSRPKFHVIPNGALVFAASPIFCTRKWIELFTETLLAFSLHFQHIGLNLEENKVHYSKESKI
jgi:hypothetical protein